MHKSIGLLASTALVLFVGLGAVQADENGGRVAMGGERGSKAAKSAVFCDGGVQEAIFTNTEQFPASSASAVFVDIPSTGVPGGASGVGTDSDIYTVTFAGEAAATSGGSWEVQILVSVNGGAFTAMDPIGPNTFKSGNKAENNSMTWCKRILATSSTSFKAQWRKLGGGTANIDDYTIQVERSN